MRPVALSYALIVALLASVFAYDCAQQQGPGTGASSRHGGRPPAAEDVRGGVIACGDAVAQSRDPVPAFHAETPDLLRRTPPKSEKVAPEPKVCLTFAEFAEGTAVSKGRTRSQEPSRKRTRANPKPRESGDSEAPRTIIRRPGSVGRRPKARQLEFCPVCEDRKARREVLRVPVAGRAKVRRGYQLIRGEAVFYDDGTVGLENGYRGRTTTRMTLENQFASALDDDLREILGVRPMKHRWHLREACSGLMWAIGATMGAHAEITPISDEERRARRKRHLEAELAGLEGAAS